MVFLRFFVANRFVCEHKIMFDSIWSGKAHSELLTSRAPVHLHQQCLATKSIPFHNPSDFIKLVKIQAFRERKRVVSPSWCRRPGVWDLELNISHTRPNQIHDQM